MTEVDAPRRRYGRVAALIAIATLGATSGWWAPPLLAHLDFFRVRRVELQGARYLSAGDVVTRLSIDTTWSVWADRVPLERRLAEHRQVRTVRIDRRLPSTLVVHVTENLPVALVASPAGFRALDATGRELPIDPTRIDVDVPIITRADTAILRLLDQLRGEHPALFAQVSDVRREGRRELRMHVATRPVRVMDDIGIERFSELAAVERDLVARRVAIAEIDLRFRDQIIVRVQ